MLKHLFTHRQVLLGAITGNDCFEEHEAEWALKGRADLMSACCNAAVVVLFSHQILVWHTRTEKPVLVNEGKKGFTDPNVEI